MSDGQAHARVWASDCRTVEIVTLGSGSAIVAEQELSREPDGFFSGVVDGVAAGTQYWLRLDGERLRPDPASRFQPAGPHGPSEVIDPSGFQWTDWAWRGPARDSLVLYEMHVGTFMREGTWRAAAEQLPELASLGITYPVLDPVRWAQVVEVVRERLLTPVGLRSLAPGHPDYKAKYYGDLRARDAAYHQGTVWAWLIGPFVDAWLKVHPDDRAGARRLLEGFDPHLNDACIGSISEIFDADEPYTARGCVSQAWSVAEVLRGLVKTGEG